METNETVNNDVAQQVTETNITETNDESNDIILCENNDNVEMEDINFNIPEDYEDFEKTAFLFYVLSQLLVLSISL